MSRFLVWCTGARPDHVQPGMERNRYVTMGLSILITTLLACGSMAVLTSFLIEDISPWVQVPIAAFWGLVVFTVDRTVAVTLVDGQRVWQQILMYFPRLLLAAGAAYLISEPLVLQVFAQEIQEQRITDAAILRDRFRAEIDARPDFVARTQEANRPVAAVQADIAVLQRQADDLGAAAEREEKGLGATGEPSCGRVCRGFRAQQEAKLAEMSTAQGRLPAAEAAAAGAVERVEDDKAAAVDTRVEEYGEADGFAARHQALESYLAGSVTAQLLRWSLTAVLVLVDLLVLTFKVLGAQTLHDMRMKVERAIVRDRLEKDLEVAKDRSLADAREESEEIAAYMREQAERARNAERVWRDRGRNGRALRSWFGGHVDRWLGRDGGDASGLDDPAARPRTAAPTGKHSPQTGDVVGNRYRLAEEIGRGGYGVVYRAEVRGGQDAAVKIQPGGRAGKSFWNDVRNIPRNGKYVAEVLEAGPHGSWRYVVYPLYRPGSLDKVWAPGRAGRSAAWCLGVVEQTLYALAAGHSSPEHIVHRDVKPGNILLDGDKVRVSDWGRARSDADDRSMALGTWKWAAPEVFDNRGGVDTSNGLSDLYSVGAVAYWLLSGQPPLAREIRDMQADLGDEGRVFAENRRLRPRPLHEIDPRIPRAVGLLVDDWLSYRARDRAGGQPEHMACLFALKLLRAAMADHRAALENLVLTPAGDAPRDTSDEGAMPPRAATNGAASKGAAANGAGRNGTGGNGAGGSTVVLDLTPPEPPDDPATARTHVERVEIIAPLDRSHDVGTEDGDPTPSNR